MSKNKSRYPIFQFRIVHLLLAMILVGPVLWLIHESTMATAEMEIVSVSRFEDSYVIEVTWNRPESLRNVGLSIIGDFSESEDGGIRPGSYAAVRKILEKKLVEYRYRKHSLLWFESESPQDMAYKPLGLEIDRIEELIENVGPPVDCP